MSKPPGSGRASLAEPDSLPKMKGGYQLMKELQKLACFQVYEHINCSGITYLEMHFYDVAYKLYHGGMPAQNGGTTIGYKSKLLHGLEAFDFLFDSVEGLAGYDGAHLVLKNYLVGRDDDARKIIVSEKEGDLSPAYMSVMGYRQMQNINGRSVWENVKQFYVEFLLGSTPPALSSLIRPCKTSGSRGNKGSRTDRWTDTYKWYS
jgi:hypothetical protein